VLVLASRDFADRELKREPGDDIRPFRDCPAAVSENDLHTSTGAAALGSVE
jgi:hypothetical protein